MIDIMLTEALLRALKGGTRLILIGDADQLPPVGSGNVLNDIIKSQRFNTVCLTEIFRQSEDSLIVMNAHKINSGVMPDLDSADKDFFHVLRTSEDSIPSAVVSLITERLPKAYGRDIIDRIQVITPSRKGRAGTEALNKLLREELNPKTKGKAEYTARGITFREGDKVMQIKNNYDIEWEKNGFRGCGIFNGDIGVITSIDEEAGEVTVTFDDRCAGYGFEWFEELEHAYAITVHKSQGSEYPVIIIPLYSCAPMLMTRNLIYTAVTRARQMVITVGNKEIMHRMVENDHRAVRYTMLSDRLSSEQ
jgi:exodeoxyribonuclease V alpha subunit